MGYLSNFIVYTFAMVGVVVFALFIFKMSTNMNVKKDSKFLAVHDTLSLGPRKTLYVVTAGNEKFLIASDVDKTNLISKLEISEKANEKEDFNDNINKLLQPPTSKKSIYMDTEKIGVNSTNSKPYNSVMKNLATRIRG